MNETTFFKPADHFKVPACNGLHPFFKKAAAVAVAQGAGPDNTRAIHRMALHRAMEAAQDLQRLGHRLRIKIAISKYAFTQPRDLAVLMECHQASTPEFGDTKPH
jgi:hypothetical protein